MKAIRRVLMPPDAVLVSVLAYEGLRPVEAFAREWENVLDEAGHPRKRLDIRRPRAHFTWLVAGARD